MRCCVAFERSVSVWWLEWDDATTLYFQFGALATQFFYFHSPPLALRLGWPRPEMLEGDFFAEALFFGGPSTDAESPLLGSATGWPRNEMPNQDRTPGGGRLVGGCA